MAQSSYNLLKSDIIQLFVDAANQIRQRSIAAGQVATGRTLNSIEVVDAGGTDAIRIGLAAWEYIDLLEYGRGPGKAPFEFEAVILDWMKAKGISGSGISDEELAAKIAWSIRLQGTKLYRSGSPLDIFNSVITDLSGQIDEAVNRRITNEVDYLITNTLKI